MLRLCMLVLVLLGALACPVRADPIPSRPASPLQPVSLPQAPWRPDPSAVRTGFVPPAGLSDFRGAPMPPGMSADLLPSRWDWRTQGKVTPVKHQGNCGACYAFGTVANFESKLLMDGAGAFDLSENNAKECNYFHTGCAGGNYFLIADLWSQTGTVLEACDPYVDRKLGVCNTSCPYLHTLLNWRQISAGSVPDTNVLKGYLYTYGPLDCTVAVADDPTWHAQMGAYDGSYTLYRPGSFQSDHHVLLVGWDDGLLPRGGSVPGAWIAKNSWGNQWGGACGYGSERGYFTMAYGSSAIGTYAGVLTEWQPYDPQGGLLLFDEAGAYGVTIMNERPTACCLARFTPPRDGSATRVEFWTLEPMADVDVYLYDEFDAARGSLSRLLRSVENLRYDMPGYYSVVIPSPPALRAGDDVIAVVKFDPVAPTADVPIDRSGPLQAGRTYLSPSGASGTWVDTTVSQLGNLGVRLRYTSGVVQPTRTPTVTPGPQRPRAFLPMIVK